MTGSDLQAPYTPAGDDHPFGQLSRRHEVLVNVLAWCVQLGEVNTPGARVLWRDARALRGELELTEASVVLRRPLTSRPTQTPDTKGSQHGTE
jgi:hypothetical protein